MRLARLDAAPGRGPDVAVGNSKRTSRSDRSRVEHDRARGAADAERAHGTSSRSARNQRSRSSHGTAAFAGDVDGSTKSSVSPSRPLLQPVLGALAERAAVGLLADEARSPAARSSRAIRSSRSALPAKSPLAQVARALRRPVGGVRDADAEASSVELLATGRRAAA